MKFLLGEASWSFCVEKGVAWAPPAASPAPLLSCPDRRLRGDSESPRERVPAMREARSCFPLQACAWDPGHSEQGAKAPLRDGYQHSVQAAGKALMSPLLFSF